MEKHTATMVLIGTFKCLMILLMFVMFFIDDEDLIRPRPRGTGSKEIIIKGD
jgi:hypothetical protein